MNRQTQQALVAVNHEFYANHAGAFDRTRSAPWKGWKRLLEAIEEVEAGAQAFRVLDLGCGNGRFGSLVEQQWPGPWSYLGLDSSAELLKVAQARLAKVDARELRTWNLLEEPPQSVAPGTYDLVAVFGLLHHVPGAALRRELLLNAARLVAPGGHLAFTVWRFGEDPRFERRVVPWSTVANPILDGVEERELEPGDVLLRWGDEEGALRYCHAAHDDEQEEWLRALTQDAFLEWKLRFDGDGKTGQLNRYVLLRRPAL